MNNAHLAAWNAFWDGSNSGAAGCLPSGNIALEKAQQAVWHRFATRIARKGRVLDIATGDGRVMAWLYKTRRDLKLIGVDAAAKLPQPPRGTNVRAGVAMEDLPFPAGQFAAITSQFGFEYGDMAATALEMRRVLADGGLVALLTHRAGGPILAHNLRRRDQIVWAIEQEDLPGIAKRSLALRQVGIATVPPTLQQAPATGAARFGPGSVAWEIAEAIRRSVANGNGGDAGWAAATIAAIEQQARHELARIDALQASCHAIADEDALNAVLAAARMRQTSVESIRDLPGNEPFADFRLIETY